MALVALALAGQAPRAVLPPEAGSGVLPDFDVRRTVTAPLRPSLAPRQADEIARLEAGLGTRLRVRWNPYSGTLRSLSVSGRALSPPSADDPETIARAFVARYPALLGQARAGASSGLEVERVVVERESGTIRVRLVQTRHGLPFLDGVVRVHLDVQGRIHRVAGSPFAGGPSGGTLRDEFRGVMAADQAVLAASQAVRPALQFVPRTLSGPEGLDRRTTFAAGPYAAEITARWIYFPMLDGPRPAWLVELRPHGFPQDYQVVVDGFTGALLHRVNRFRYAVGSGRVLDVDPNVVDEDLGTDRPGVAPEGSLTDVTNHRLKVFGPTAESPLGVLGPSGYLHGNNVHVFDGETTTEGEFRPGLDFDFAFNTRGASQTQVFNLNNFVHDYYYRLGFDEQNGNFQADNRGLLPPGDGDGDEVEATSRDVNSYNNAHFGAPPDGNPGLMMNTLWSAPAGHAWGEDLNDDGVPDLDGAYDSDVVIHEMHHGVSMRLVGGRHTTSCFESSESLAMGEGGGDFFAYHVNDDPYLGEWLRPPAGVRSINAKTYGDFSCRMQQIYRICGSHDNGEIWANVLWDVRQRFLADNVGGARFRALDIAARLYIDGLKSAACNPDMLELRDAMIDADQLAHGGRNLCRLWEEFAGRGMGVGAESLDDVPDRLVPIEDFDVPPACADGGPPPPLPGETAGLRFLSADTLRWDPEFDAFSYEIYRGDRAGLAAGDYGSCVTGSDPDPQDVTFVDLAVPSPGSCWTYLVAAANASGRGPLGLDSAGNPRNAGSPCP